MQFTWILFSILGLAAASPLDTAKIREELLSHNVHTRNSALENLILGLLEDLRETMQNGSDTVPVLDPLEIEYLRVDDEILPLPGASLTLNDMTVSKLSTFVVDSLQVRSTSIILQRYRIEFEVHLPLLEFEAADYDLAVSAAGVNIFGKGDAKINIIRPKINGSLLVAPRISLSGIFLNILESNISFDLDEFESEINGLLNDGAMSMFINTFLKHFVPELVKLYEAEITEFLSATVLEVGNGILADLNLIDILGFNEEIA